MSTAISRSASNFSEKSVSDAFRRHYMATGKSADAWNATLDELAGSALNPRRGQVANVLRKVADPIVEKLRGKVETKMVTLDVRRLDVWGNARDGYEVNDVYPSRGSITIPIDAHHDEIVRALKSEGFVDKNVHVKSGLPFLSLTSMPYSGSPSTSTVYRILPRHGSPGSSGSSGGGGARAERR